MGLSSGTENRPLTSLRAFAAVWVIFSHITPVFADQWTGLSWQMLRAGYMGVDVFFVLSGFILGLVYQKLAVAGVGRFLLRRVLRLYPLNIAVLIGIAALSWTVLPLGSWTDPRKLPQFILMLEGFRSAPVPAWNPVTWSVGIELACYACFPWVIMGLRRLPTVALGPLAVALLMASWWAQGFCLGWPFGWHGLVRGMSSFWPGVVLATLALQLPRCPAPWASLGEVGCVVLLAAVVALDTLRWVPALTAGLVFLLFSDAGIVARELRRPWIFWLGEISFSIYLLFGVMLPQLLWVERWLARFMAPPGAIALFVAFYLAVVFALASVTYVTIERPCRRLGRARQAHAKPIGQSAGHAPARP